MQELEARAKDHGTTPKRELEDCVVNALFYAIDQAGGILTANLRKTLRTLVNDLVTTNLLGAAHA